MSGRTAFRTTPSDSSSMPTGVPNIIGNEAAERFSFYGMKGILAVFMAEYLHLMGNIPGTAMSEAAANERYHAFNMAVYLTPFLGAILADAIFGKYQIIMWLSLVYCMGHFTLAFMGLSGPAGWWLFAGLSLIAIGSGGIKPCVSAHVGDQFGPNNRHLLPKVFAAFYFSINLGALLSQVLIPSFLEWQGPHVAFGVPGILMALATLVFWMGRHRFVHIPPG
jgi:POT family proton-dependent oligopeptide transporter